jgi:ABC-type uncharacterized transport system permease subunit
MVTYDPAILVVFANRLYAQARWAVFKTALAGAVLGALAALMVSAASRSSDAPVVMVMGALVFGFFGVIVGLDRAFAYKLEAQRTLCVLQTEINTRTNATLAAMTGAMPGRA